jgi:hypothetical protein
MATGDRQRTIDLPPFANDILEALAAKGARPRRQVIIDALLLLSQTTDPPQNDYANAQFYRRLYGIRSDESDQSRN